jgi:HNH/Endo VII superfamily nuclease toxin with a HHH motif
MTNAPGKAKNAAGFPRNGPWFWRQMLKNNPEMFSDANKAAIRAGKSPVVDDTWINYNPTHQSFTGDKLIHHHIDQGPIASGLPETIHQGWHGELHPGP